MEANSKDDEIEVTSVFRSADRSLRPKLQTTGNNAADDSREYEKDPSTKGTPAGDAKTEVDEAFTSIPVQVLQELCAVQAVELWGPLQTSAS